MRLDHLLSKETGNREKLFLTLVRQGKVYVRHCLILRVSEKRTLKVEKVAYPENPLKHGGVAQLGEHLPCKQGVRSSILLISTTKG